MALLTTNGMSIDDLTVAPNGPGLVQQLGNQVDLFYGSNVASAAALPASGRFLGHRVFCVAEAEPATWDGAFWQGVTRTYTPTVTSATVGTASVSYILSGRWITAEFDVVLGGAITANPTISLPSGMKFAATQGKAIGTVQLTDSSPAASRLGQVSMSNDTAVSMSYEQSNARTGLAPAAPWTWANGDALRGIFSARITTL